ncbi:Y1252-like protein [Mya arenaria]|uniref:Y1252-like protein n=1 Tax=Mya arenaria TaxID=6604 RepID=A0ABY7FJR7_MYAAR|nr:Y1252-like protein [Mya arenaria]
MASGNGKFGCNVSPEERVEYFASFGKIKVQELGLENGLQIDLNKGNKTLTFRGKRCDIKAMDDRLKTYFQLKKIKIALPRNILPTFEGTAMAAVSEQQCCYSINWRPSAEKGPGNRLIASWKSKDGNGVTLIQGRLFDLDVDAVVILANTSMSPRTTIAEEDIEPRMLEVHIRNGTLIADQKADIIVNTTGKSLQLEKGGALSRSIVLAAGVQLQDELSKEYPGGLNEGQIAVTSSGKLSRNGVHEIIHCVLPKFDKEKFDDDIKAMVKTCLAEADKLQGKSIALPPFGTGRHGYPIRETALAMFEAIDEFSEESVGMTLQTIYIPTLEDEHCKAFISAQSKRSSSPDRKKINNGLNWEEKKDNDYTWIGISDEISHIVHAVETVLDACIEKMITDVALFSPVQQLDREDVQFVQTVIRAFERDPAKLRYLRSALILLDLGTNVDDDYDVIEEIQTKQTVCETPKKPLIDAEVCFIVSVPSKAVK